MKRTSINVTIALFLGLGLTLVSLWLLGRSSSVALAQGPDGYSTYYVAPSCDGVPLPCYTTLQAAVDAADDPEDVVKVAAGTYTDVSVRPRNDVTTTGVVTQVVYISKTVTIRGGYTTAFTDPPNPKANPTTLDAKGQGRVLYITGDPSASSGQVISPTIEGLRITGGDAGELGGGLWEYDAGGGVYAITAAITFSDNQLFSNSAYFGGGLALLSSNGTMLRGSVITANTADSGGGLFLNDSVATISGNTVVSNTAADIGGGLCLFSGNVTLSGNTVTGNSANIGGGLHLAASAATLSNNTVVSNTANYGGGLQLLDADDITFSGNGIRGNSAEYGGGIHLYNSAAMLSSNIITANTAYSGGGGVMLDSSAALLNANTIISNTANNWGGGLYLYESAAELNNNMVTANASEFGGGLLLNFSDATLSANTVVSNAADFGGGLFLNSSDATLSGNTVTANIATDGGGLCIYYNSNATLINNLVADNRVDNEGGGLYILGSSPRLLHTTIARNRGGDGSGIYLTDDAGGYSTVALTNTILVSHTVGITVTPGNTASLEATLWGSGTWANGTDWGGTGTIVTGTHNYWGDPAFVNPNLGDYHIGPGSAALDRGVDAGVTLDIDGDPRPVGAGYDLGADEFPTAVSTEHFIYLPLVLRQSP
jgi:hypothetical protein